MLLKRLPRLQFLLPAWTSWKLVPAQQSMLMSSSGPLNRSKQLPESPTLSLFEELFPEEANASENKLRSPSANVEPKGPLRDELLRELQWAKSRPLPSASAVKPRAGDDTAQPLRQSSAPNEVSDHYEFRERRDASVLILSNASKSLSLSDFLRLSPKGDHIDGWATGIIKVIPGRDPNTLEPLGHYYILFSTDAAARAYMDQINRLHRISKIYTRSSITSPLPPPPGYLKDGEDLHALMQAFTLIPSSQQNVSLRMLKKPVQPAMQRMIAEGGHRAIAARQSRSEDMVLFSLDKGHIGTYDLRAAIGRDGKERNLQWNLLSGEDDVVGLDGTRSDDWNAAGGDGHQDAGGRKRKRRPPSRFIISFKDNYEARRFVRAWHRRPFPQPQEQQHGPQDEAPPIVNAELLW